MSDALLDVKALFYAARNASKDFATGCREAAADGRDFYAPERTMRASDGHEDLVCTLTAEWHESRPDQMTIVVSAVTYPAIQTADSAVGRSVINDAAFAPTLDALRELGVNGLEAGPTPEHYTITVRI
jgi:hypothetical protein